MKTASITARSPLSKPLLLLIAAIVVGVAGWSLREGPSAPLDPNTDRSTAGPERVEPGAVDEGAPDAVRSTPPGGRISRETERARLRADLLELARSGDAAFLSRIREMLAGSTDAQMVALELWCEDPARDAVPVLADALLAAGAAPEVTETALATLHAHSRRDPRARDALLSFLETAPESAAQRSLAFGAVLSTGESEQVADCMQLLQLESEPDVVVSATRALAAHTDPATRQRVESLHWRHPDPEVRRRLRELRIGR